MSGILALNMLNKRTVRGPVNSMDKSTVISMYPRAIDETKETITPGRFVIPAGSIKNPAFLVVGSSAWWREIDDEMPLLEIPNSSVQVADSIVRDYCNGLLGCDMVSAMPAIFWVPGELKWETIKREYSNLIDEAIAKQNQYYRNLVKMADSLWSRTNGNPISISDDMRLAANELNLLDKPWNKDNRMMQLVPCVSCGSMRNPEYPVCPNCKTVVDVTKATAMGIKFLDPNVENKTGKAS